ncbi:box C/D snoRNA protein 1 isoform X2 [Drosophila guanche]|uniref:box C/D snoRNA protein 1 isoform X2 n=1 Tax=Drosophila guanche TaxID=7266 RepID=UPI001471396E|nr:box C/D snoRNA protein 1 isoform X2 [Drosophila guanche]
MSEKADTSVKSLRLGVCEVCGGKEAHYACPKCEVKTCSVACVQIHKRELVCDGVRDRTKFVPLSEMTERELLSDYCFLEECTRYADDRKFDLVKRYTQQQRYLPVPQHRMRAAAQKRNIQLSLLLPHFSRHKENTTFLDWKRNRFFWRIDWLFVNAAEEDEDQDDPIKSARFADARCDEELTLANLLLKYLDLQQETAREKRKLLVRHQTVGIGGLSFWLQAEGVRRSATRCYHLEANRTLRENLSGKTIVEFPTIFVTYSRQPPAGYETIDNKESDDDLTGTASDPESEDEPISAHTPKKAKVLHDLNEIHDVYHALAAAYSDGNDSEADAADDCEIEGVFREDIEL